MGAKLTLKVDFRGYNLTEKRIQLDSGLVASMSDREWSDTWLCGSSPVTNGRTLEWAVTDHVNITYQSGPPRGSFWKVTRSAVAYCGGTGSAWNESWEYMFTGDVYGDENFERPVPLEDFSRIIEEATGLQRTH